MSLPVAIIKIVQTTGLSNVQYFQFACIMNKIFERKNLTYVNWR